MSVRILLVILILLALANLVTPLAGLPESKPQPKDDLREFGNASGVNLPPEVLTKLYSKNTEHVLHGLQPGPAKPGQREMKVKPTDDFEVNGKGDAKAWDKAEWESLNARGEKGLPYETKVKALYSKKGLYVLMEATDAKLSAKFEKDYENLWTEDVFEVFLWTDQRDPLYFEYEISPLGRELPIMVPNNDGQFMGWLPWHYSGNRKIRKATSAIGGEMKSGADVKGWRAEIFIPYELLNPLRNIPPKAGTRWRTNFYRMDYDDGKQSSWDWSRVGNSFHEYQKFGTLVFE